MIKSIQNHPLKPYKIQVCKGGHQIRVGMCRIRRRSRGRARGWARGLLWRRGGRGCRFAPALGSLDARGGRREDIGVPELSSSNIGLLRSIGDGRIHCLYNHRRCASTPSSLPLLIRAAYLQRTSASPSRVPRTGSA